MPIATIIETLVLKRRTCLIVIILASMFLLATFFDDHVAASVDMSDLILAHSLMNSFFLFNLTTNR